MRAQVIGNPVTGEAYLCSTCRENPPPPMALGFTPDQPYIPSMPSPLSTVRDRLPDVLERAEVDAEDVSREIVARIPASLDRSDRFFTNVERIVRESDLPTLSADSRKFFATTSAQIEAIASNLDGLVGDEGTLSKFATEARSAIKAADLPASGRATRDAMDQTSLAAEDLRRSLPAIRESLEQLRELARQLQEQPESVVYGPRPAGQTEMMFALAIRSPGLAAGMAAWSGVPSPPRTARHRSRPHGRAAARGAAGAVADAPDATAVRLLETQARATSAAACCTSVPTAS